ncbi:MAG TPA: OstA-like protein, partial [Cytophagaceae bacterium]
EMLMYCDSAYQYSKKNGLEAFGHVRIVQGDSVTVTGNTLTYNGDTKNAIVKGNVVFKDRSATLTTDVLEYNLSTKLATYTTGGVIRDQKNTLTSQIGHYDSKSKFFYFVKNVKVVNPQFTLVSDTLDYNTRTKIAYFHGPSKIISQDGVIYADKGEYNTQQAVSNFKGKAKVESGSYTLTGDNLFYDEKNRRGVVKNNVKVVSPKDNIIIEGDMAYYWGNKGTSKIFGRTLMKNIMAGGDTLYITADTMLSVDNNIPSQKRMFAYNNVRIYRADLQGRSDSLVYNFADSSIYFYDDPVLWSETSQILADSININMVNQKIHKMNMSVNSFIISEDTLKNFNQVKGKKMTAFFANSKINKVDINGNGESLYFALEGDSAIVGINKVICSDMVIKFENSKVNGITFITNPDALFIPPHELKDPEKRLKGFRWRVKEKPTKKEILTRRL